MNFTFPYQEQRGVDPSPAAPERPVFRPKIPVQISGPRGDHSIAVALVDTGADETILPLSVARPLRVRLDSKIHSLRDANNNPIYVRYGVVRLTIAQIGVGEYTWETKVGFQKYRRYSILPRGRDLLHGFAGLGKKVG